MKILALELSSAQRSIAVLDTASTRGVSCFEMLESGGRSVHAFEMIEAALRQAQLEREQIEIVAIGLGPGSYTGIRAAISVAQGWQLAREVKLVGVSSADCLAAQAQADFCRGHCGVLIDAQRGEFYLAEYQLSDNGWENRKPLRLISNREVEPVLASGLPMFGPEIDRWYPTGTVSYPRAATVARLAAGAKTYVSGEQLEPIYLRQTTFVKAPPPRVWAED